MKLEIVSVSIVSNQCYMCSNPWKFRVFAEGLDEPLYLCREHLEKARKNWQRKILKVEERDAVSL